MDNKFAKKYDSLDDIPNGDYEGYFWASNSKEPKKILDESSLTEMKSIHGNPFVMEALLYDRKAEISIHVQHTGRQQIICYNWKAFDESSLISEHQDKATFIPQKINGIKCLEFQRIWKKEKDPLCADKDVLKMYALVFTGFKPLKS